jgi:DNA-binding IclR family transcriptional regulator
MSAVKTRTVPALYNALSILELLTGSHAGMTLSELMEQCNLAKSSIHYLLVTLERCGYILRSDRSGRYLLSVKLLSMANSSLTCLGIRHLAAPYLFGLRMRTGLTAHLGILEHNEAVLIARQGDEAHLASWVGKRMALHCTAIGKAILAHLPHDEIELILRTYALARHNENTIASLPRLKTELERVIEVGYAVDNEEDELGVRCLGVPVLGFAKRPVAAISLAGSTREIDLENVPRLAEELLQTARALSEVMANSTASVISSSEEVSDLPVSNLVSSPYKRRDVGIKALSRPNAAISRSRRVLEVGAG